MTMKEEIGNLLNTTFFVFSSPFLPYSQKEIE